MKSQFLNYCPLEKTSTVRFWLQKKYFEISSELRSEEKEHQNAHTIEMSEMSHFLFDVTPKWVILRIFILE